MVQQTWAASSRGWQIVLAILVVQTATTLIPSCQGKRVQNFTTGFPLVPSPEKPWRMHTLFSVECQDYFDWQTVGLVHSLRKSGHPGPVTRLLSCTDDALATYKGMDLAPTLVVPSMSLDPVTKDWYPAINKPAGVVHWLSHSPDANNADWVLILDADMIVRKPILPWEVQADIGRPASASYEYLIGCDNELAQLHTKHPEFCDKVGGFILMHIDDLRAMAPLWLSKTQAVRADKAHWLTNITGDIYGHGWISEMYGYSFGAAEVGLRHKINDTLMIYPGYIPLEGVEPQLLHYGLRFNVGTWNFSKADHHEDHIVYECNKFFNPPPFPDQVKTLEPDFRQRRGLLLSLECVNTINEGLLLHHERSGCPKLRPTRYVTFLKENIAGVIVRAGTNSSKEISEEQPKSTLGAVQSNRSIPDDVTDLGTHETKQDGPRPEKKEDGDSNRDLQNENKLDANTSSRPRIHTLFSVECNTYFDWQTVGLMHSFHLSGQPGSITRLLSCTEDKLKAYKDLDLAPTHVVPSMSRHPLTGDWYPAINKPAAVVHWLNHVKTDAEYIVILDADMILRGPITPWELGAKRGYPVSAPYDYLIGCDNLLAELHTKNPKGCQKVGGVIVMHVEDLQQFAPLWLHKTEEVRADRMHWSTNITGDVYGQGWISEMYGYVFGAAELGLTHIIQPDIMLYPGYIPPPGVEPRVLHYGLEWTVGNWSFDKANWHEKDMVNECWAFFPEPPDISTLDTSEVEEGTYRRDSIGVECVKTLNEALYFHHVKRGCPEKRDDRDDRESENQEAVEENNVEDQAYEDLAADEKDDLNTQGLRAENGDGDDSRAGEVTGDENDGQDNNNRTVGGGYRSPSADHEEVVTVDSVVDRLENSSFEERTRSLTESRKVPVIVSPRYWKVALWTLLVTCFLLIVSSVSRHQSKLDKSQHRGQRSRQLKIKVDTDSSNDSGLPLSSVPSSGSAEKGIP